jgi:DNA-binding LacI/PurR family transcriptional regulator
VAIYDTTLFGPASTLAAIEEAAHSEDYYLSVVTLRSLELKSLAGALERLQQQRADGILVIVPLTIAVNTLPSLATHVPLVAVETGPDDGVPVVAIDQRAGAALATQHLLDLGHATVHHLSGPPGFLEAQQRLDSWRDTLHAAGAWIARPIAGDWSARSGYDATRQLLRHYQPTAVFAANDQDGARCAASASRERQTGPRRCQRGGI